MAFHKARIIDIPDDDAGQRLDNFLMRILKNIPKGRIYQMVRKGEVRINKGRCKVSDRLAAGDKVRVPPVTLPDEKPQEVNYRAQNELANSVLYEDDAIMVINKPSGIAVHGGTGVNVGVIETLRQMHPEIADRLELVHRLDRDTSGCLIIAKKRSALRVMHEMIRGNEMNKRYYAIVKGRWDPKVRKVDVPLKRALRQSGERVVHVDRTGKASLTRYRIHRQYKTVTWMDIKLETGRTHQIRVHSLHMGHPLVGDEKYGDEAYNREMKSKGLKRLCLHAYQLEFNHPLTGKPLSIEAPMDPEIEQALKGL